jgi:UDP-glucose 4-epimerase
MARYLVTGGAGFVGSHLVESLQDQGHRVRVLDDLSSGSRVNLPSDIDLVVADVTDPEALAAAFDGIDGCFHLAAIASVERSHRGWLRTHQVNLTGTINVFDQAARRTRQRRTVPVVYASSAAVYGDCRSVPIGEDTPAIPLSAYGADKLACELHARIAGAIHGVPTTGLRFFNLYGPRQDPRSPYSGVISIFADRLLRGEPVEIFGDGDQVRDFTYVGDAVAALNRALATASTASPVVNVCTGRGTSVRSLAETLASLCDTRLVTHRRPARPGDIAKSIGDPRRAAEQLGATADTGLAAGLTVTLAALAHSRPIEDRIVA